MKNFSELQNKSLSELCPSEIDAIRSAYMDYFDEQKPRDKAIGYMVVCGGIPAARLGHIDMLIGCPMGWQLKIGRYVIFMNMQNMRFFNAIDGYIKNYKEAYELMMRLEQMWKPGEVYYDQMPLFRSGSTKDRLGASCAGKVIQRANRELGWKTTGFALHQLGHDMILPWNAAAGDSEQLDRQSMLSFCTA